VHATIQKLLEQALSAAAKDASLATLASMDPQTERTRDARHGDFTSNVAMRAAKKLGQKPRELAERIAAAIPESDIVHKVDIAGPGFINLTLSAAAYREEMARVLSEKQQYGSSESGQGRRVLVEFVSANPTGPLHVGHGRHAAFGASLANILRATGHHVDTEYYVNDAGRQMDILALSVWLRYLELAGMEFEFPHNCYQGGYCRTIATTIASQSGTALTGDPAVLRQLIADESHEPEAKLDALIGCAKSMLGPEGFAIFFDAAIEEILGDIRDDLHEFGVDYDRWYSERSLTENNSIDNAISKLRASGRLYEKDGATWFRTTDFGDDKDRVVIRENGAMTYFASDIAYHKEKCERGYDLLINAFGSDHHGYIARLQAALAGFGQPADILEVRLVQFVVLFRGSEKVQMTTRGGKYVTLRDLREEVGNDAARFFYVSRSNDQHLDFDLELAKSASNDNPVYYVQYAHARISSTLRRLDDSGAKLPVPNAAALASLCEAEELQLMRQISRYGEVIQTASDNRAPQIIVQYLRDLAAEFHSFYNAQRIIVDDPQVRDARCLLITAAQQVLANGLALLGVAAPDTM
jgi:arginyl-tRNA synthetase